jgi:hypothetical protein
VKDNAELQTQLDEAAREAAALRKRHEKTRKDLKSNEESLKAARAELDRVQEDNRRGRDARAALDAELAAVRSALAESKSQHAELSGTHAATVAELAERTRAMASLEEAIATASSRIEEIKVEHTIGLRLTRQLNRELKAQLGAESRRSAKLERELAAATKGSASAKGACPLQARVCRRGYLCHASSSQVFVTGSCTALYASACFPPSPPFNRRAPCSPPWSPRHYAVDVSAERGRQRRAWVSCGWTTVWRRCTLPTYAGSRRCCCNAPLHQSQWQQCKRPCGRSCIFAPRWRRRWQWRRRRKGALSRGTASRTRWPPARPWD